MEVSRLADGRVELRWATTPETYLLERAAALGPFLEWQVATESSVTENGQFVVRTQPAETARFYRLRLLSGPLLTVAGTSPTGGEGGIAVTRETVFHLTAPLGSGSLLAPAHLRAVAGGRQILSRAELSDDHRRATLYYLENLPAGSQVVVTFDGTGLTDELGRTVDLDGKPDGAAG